jgi:hypothetical protein
MAPDHRIFQALIAACLLWVNPSVYAQTQECFSPAPIHRDALVNISMPPPMPEAQQQLLGLLEKLNGNWHGDTEGFFCSSSKNKPALTADNYEIELEARTEREKRGGNNARFDLKATLESDSREATNQRDVTRSAFNSEKIQYTMKNGILYAGLSQANPVIVRDLRNSSVTLIESVPSHLKSGATTQRIILRKITLPGARKIQIENYYYMHGQLSSFSKWTLKR